MSEHLARACELLHEQHEAATEAARTLADELYEEARHVALAPPTLKPTGVPGRPD